MAVICQRDAVKLWPQFSAPSPLVWESWTWVPMICRIQEWSCSLLDWGVHTVDWRLSGQLDSMCKRHHKITHQKTFNRFASIEVRNHTHKYRIFIRISVLCVCVCVGCLAAWSHRKAVLLWPQLWAPTPPIWESWTWATITRQETQELRCSLLDWRTQAGDWTLSGMERTAHHSVTMSPTRIQPPAGRSGAETHVV